MKLLILSSLILFGACTDKKASWETQENARRQAMENAAFSAKKWRLKYAKNYRLIMRGDSTISAKCPMGDGWVSVTLEKDQTKIELKCSSVSESLGCMKSDDFKSKRFAEEDGACNRDLPFPLPKIVK